MSIRTSEARSRGRRNLDQGHDPVGGTVQPFAEPQSSPASIRLLLRVQEAAEALGVSRTSLYVLLRAGDIPSLHIGRSVRVPVAALHSYIDQHTKFGRVND